MVFIRNFLYQSRKLYPKVQFHKPTVFSLFGKTFAVSFSIIKHVKPVSGDNESSVKSKGEITKSYGDKRAYRGLEFGNKLKVLLISDPDTNKAAAAINVGVGYYSDPDDLPGLAHFCEHMLFLGTKKYPDEDEYSKYLKDHGGFCNAVTSSDYTTYYFDVLPAHFEGALDRFSQFFLTPLFTESATEREVHAVNSEYEKNVPVDFWRYSALEKLISKKNHPFSKFGIGNLKTLSITPKEKGIDVRNELLKFHKHWYSSNIMTLVLLGKESLDDLEKLATNFFLSIENKEVTKPEWNESPFGPEHLQTKSYVVPVSNTRHISLVFPAPDYQEYYKSKPFLYLKHLISHGGPGSLTSALKAKGWSNNVYCDYQREARGFAFFVVTADLTEEGIDHVEEITTLLFQYVNMLKKEGPKKWIFDELKLICETNFRFKDKEVPVNYVSSLAKSLHDYQMEDVLVGPYECDEWRPDLIEEAMSYIDPKFVKISVIGQKFKDIATETEPWFGTKYKLEKIPVLTIKKWKNCGLNEELKLPNPNPFLSSNHTVLPRDESAKNPHPVIIENSITSRTWFKQDDEFLLPKAHICFEFKSPLANVDALNSVLTDLFVANLKDSFSEYDYDCKLAGLSWSIERTNYGMMLSIGGYNDKMEILLNKIFEKMTDFQIDNKRFEIIKEMYIRRVKNFATKQPFQQAMTSLYIILSERGYMKEDILGTVDFLTPERLNNFIPVLLSKFYIETFIYGNMNKEKAQKIIDIVDNRVFSKSATTPILSGQSYRNREIQLEDGSYFAFEMPNDFFSNSCTQTYFQCDVISTKNNMLTELLLQIIQNPCFNILRTQEQLGYIVASGIKRSNCEQGLFVIVQSDRHPLQIEQRIEAFLIQFREIVKNMSSEEFERHKESMATVKLQKPKSFTQSFFKLWKEIETQQYHFDRAEVEVAYLKTITKEQLLEFFDEFIKYGAPHRRKLSVHILAKGEGGAGNKEEPDPKTLSCAPEKDLTPPPPYIPPTKIEDLPKFKSTHGLYPLVQPYMNVNPVSTKSKL